MRLVNAAKASPHAKVIDEAGPKNILKAFQQLATNDINKATT